MYFTSLYYFSIQCLASLEMNFSLVALSGIYQKSAPCLYTSTKKKQVPVYIISKAGARLC